MIRTGETELLPPEDLTPHPKNARRGDIESIAASIRANGWYGRVMGQRSTGYILVGNHRVAAARRAGLDTIPVEWIDVDDELALRILLADNRSSDLAGYELPGLAEILEEVAASNPELSGTLFHPDHLEQLLADLAPPDENAWSNTIGSLSSEDREPYQQMTFSLHDEQAERVKAAIDAAKRDGLGVSNLNENSNANALAAIAERYLA